MNNSLKCTLTCLLALGTTVSAADVPVERVISASTVWTADNTYILDGYTFVVTPQGASEPTRLTIEPGTVIKGNFRDDSEPEASALVIARGAQIHAEGTPLKPIIFTSELDDLNGNLGIEDTNLWGGLVVLGNARINSRADSQPAGDPAQDQIEGFTVDASEIGHITFGGTDDEDNSGVLRYISIRHGGAVLGSANEINGLTLGGVGRQTLIEYIEVFANKDDGIEWFGGTVDVRYAVVAFGNDDAFDYDQGWRGRGQYLFAIGTDIGDDKMDKAGEHDGATSPIDAEPFGGGRFYNATYIGIGPGDSSQIALNIRDNAASKYSNSIFVNFARMIDLENDVMVDGSGNNMVATTDRIDFRNNVWWSHIEANNNAAAFNARPDGINGAFTEAFFTDASFGNVIADPMLRGISYTADGGLNPLPAPGSPALDGNVAVPSDDWFEATSFKGAFRPDYNWMANWTKLAQEGYLDIGQTWFPHPQLGWIYTWGGGLQEFSWIWVANLGRWAFYYVDQDGMPIIGVL